MEGGSRAGGKRSTGCRGLQGERGEQDQDW